MSSVVDFDVGVSECLGYFHSYESAMGAIEIYQEVTGMKFVVAWGRKKEFDMKNMRGDLKPYKVYFNDGENSKVKGCHMTYDGIPYIGVGNRFYDCQYGADRNLYHKRRYRESVGKKNEAHQEFENKAQFTKKRNCPAGIYLREIIKFPDFAIPANTEFYRKKGSASLQAALGDGTACGEIRVYVSFPCISDHANHSIKHKVIPTLDPRIENKIQELVLQGTTNLTDIREKLTNFVHTELFEWEKWPDKSDLRYYPRRSHIKSIVNNIITQIRSSQIDMENIEAEIESMKASCPEDKLLFQAKLGEVKLEKVHTSQQMLLLIQTKRQQEILACHLEETCVLYSVYKSSDVCLPLYFLLVKTNCDYHVIGSFLLLNVTGDALHEALSIFCDWNPKWNPPAFMCGLPDVEISVIKQAFPSTRILLCDYQRERVWDAWLSNKVNKMAARRESILDYLRSMTHAASPEEFSVAEESFFLCDTYQNAHRLQQWFSKWKAMYQRWAWCYREDVDSSYDSVERVNHTLQHHSLPPSSTPTPLSHILSALIHHVLPALYVYYVENSDEQQVNIEPTSEELSNKCREVLDQIRDYTFLVSDSGALQRLHNSLVAAHHEVLQHGCHGDVDHIDVQEINAHDLVVHHSDIHHTDIDHINEHNTNIQHINTHNNNQHTQDEYTITPKLIKGENIYKTRINNQQAKEMDIRTSELIQSVVKCERINMKDQQTPQMDMSTPDLIESGVEYTPELLKGVMKCENNLDSSKDVFMASPVQSICEEVVVGSYVVHNNILEPVKMETSLEHQFSSPDKQINTFTLPKVSMVQESLSPILVERIETYNLPKMPAVQEIANPMPVKYIKTYNSSEISVVQETMSPPTTVEGIKMNTAPKMSVVLQGKSRPVDRLKLIPPEIFKLLLPSDEKLKSTALIDDQNNSSMALQPKTFRILVPVKKRLDNSSSVETTVAQEIIDDSTPRFTRSKRKLGNINDEDEPLESKEANKSNKVVRISKPISSGTLGRTVCKPITKKQQR